MSDLLNPFSVATLRRSLRLTLFVGKWLMPLLPASVEAYLRSNFGRRYVRLLAGAFLLFLFCYCLNPAPTAFTSGFLLGLFLLAGYHFIHVSSRRRRGVAEPHSASAGDSWIFWQRLGLGQPTVQCYVEPALCGIAGWLLSIPDPFIAFWLMASAVALFIKEQINRVRITRRIIDANDAKVAAQSLNAGLRHYQQGPGQIAQKSHRAHFPKTGQKPRP